MARTSTLLTPQDRRATPSKSRISPQASSSRSWCWAPHSAVQTHSLYSSTGFPKDGKDDSHPRLLLPQSSRTGLQRISLSFSLFRCIRQLRILTGFPLPDRHEFKSDLQGRGCKGRLLGPGGWPLGSAGSLGGLPGGYPGGWALPHGRRLLGRLRSREGSYLWGQGVGHLRLQSTPVLGVHEAMLCTGEESAED